LSGFLSKIFPVRFASAEIERLPHLASGELAEGILRSCRDNTGTEKTKLL